MRLKMKKIIAVLLVIVSVFALPSCTDISGSKDTTQDNEFLSEIKQHIEDERTEAAEVTTGRIVMEAVSETTEAATEEETSAPETTAADTTVKADTTAPVTAAVTQPVYIRQTEPVTQSQSIGVYITPTGECYHFDQDCGGKNSFPTTLEKAKSQGYRPCKKCAGG